jgi:large subunit ribosomal protein L6
MSRVGKVPIPVPNGVEVSITGDHIVTKGPKGELSRDLPPHVSVVAGEGTLIVERESDDRTARAMHGLARSLVNNMVVGVHEGFAKTLEIVGVGYRVESKKDYLVFSLGYSHPIYFEVPGAIDAKIETPTRLNVSGADKQLVGAVAAKIRSFRPPEPYKGKGIKYSDETIRRKEGKSGAR